MKCDVQYKKELIGLSELSLPWAVSRTHNTMNKGNWCSALPRSPVGTLGKDSFVCYKGTGRSVCVCVCECMCVCVCVCVCLSVCNGVFCILCVYIPYVCIHMCTANQSQPWSVPYRLQLVLDVSWGDRRESNWNGSRSEACLNIQHTQKIKVFRLH